LNVASGATALGSVYCADAPSSSCYALLLARKLTHYSAQRSAKNTMTSEEEHVLSLK
jgi:hypothetical protein